MYSKEEVIKQIGEELWADFEFFVMGVYTKYDENGLEIYFAKDVSEFCLINGIK